MGPGSIRKLIWLGNTCRSFSFLVSRFSLGAIVAASEITDEPANHLPNPFGLRVEALEVGLRNIPEIECDVKMALHFNA
jgi:hypothetical protein